MVVVALLARGPLSLEAILGRRGLFSDPWKKKVIQIDASGKERVVERTFWGIFGLFHFVPLFFFFLSWSRQWGSSKKSSFMKISCGRHNEPSFSPLIWEKGGAINFLKGEGESEGCVG